MDRDRAVESIGVDVSAGQEAQTRRVCIARHLSCVKRCEGVGDFGSLSPMKQRGLILRKAGSPPARPQVDGPSAAAYNLRPIWRRDRLLPTSLRCTSDFAP